MPRIALRLCVAVATFLFSFTVSKVLPPYHAYQAVARTEAERQVLDTEAAYVAAHLDRDTAALDGLLADDFTFEYPFGRVTDKAQRLALVASPEFRFTDIQTRDVEVAVTGDTARVFGHAQVRVRVRDAEFTTPWYDYTRTFARDANGRWQVTGVRVLWGGGRRW